MSSRSIKKFVKKVILFVSIFCTLSPMEKSEKDLLIHNDTTSSYSFTHKALKLGNKDLWFDELDLSDENKSILCSLMERSLWQRLYGYDHTVLKEEDFLSVKKLLPVSAKDGLILKVLLKDKKDCFTKHISKIFTATTFATGIGFGTLSFFTQDPSFALSSLVFCVAAIPVGVLLEYRIKSDRIAAAPKCKIKIKDAQIAQKQALTLSDT